MATAIIIVSSLVFAACIVVTANMAANWVETLFNKSRKGSDIMTFCADCRFFDEMTGTCRFGPPTHEGFPHVDRGAWCGGGEMHE